MDPKTVADLQMLQGRWRQVRTRKTGLSIHQTRTRPLGREPGN